MAYRIHAIPAADAAGLTAPYDGTAEAVFVDADGNPIDITGCAPAPGSVTTEMLAASAVTREKISANAVTLDKIADGVIPAAYMLPAAGTELGGVKKGKAVAAMAVADPPAAADAPTKAEYDALLAYAKGLKATLNNLVASLKASGAIA